MSSQPRYSRKAAFRSLSSGFEPLEERRLLASCSATVDGDWHSILGGSDTGLIDGSIGEEFNGELTWQAEPGKTVVHDGTIFLLTNRRLRALDITNGVEKWSRPFSAFTDYVRTSGLAYDDGRIFFSTEHRFYSVDAQSGEVVWDVPLANYYYPINYPPVIHGSKIFVNRGVSVLALDKNSGQFLFSIRAEQSQRWLPTVYEGRLFAFFDGDFFELNPEDGEIVWKLDVQVGERRANSASLIYVIPRIVDGVAYISLSRSHTSDERDLGTFAIDVNLRRRLWQNSNLSSIQPLVIGDTSVFGADRSGGVWELSTETGSGQRGFGGARGIALPRHGPLVTSELVILSGTHATEVFDRESGELRFRLPSGSAILASNTLVIAESDGTLAYSLCSSRLLRIEGKSLVKETDGEISLTIGAGELSRDGLVVSLVSSDPARVPVPESIKIFHRHYELDELVLAIQDDTDAQGDGSITITARAPGYREAKFTFEMLDDDSAFPTQLSKDQLVQQRLRLNRSGYIPGSLGLFLPEEPAWSARVSTGRTLIDTAVGFSKYGGPILNGHTGDRLFGQEDEREHSVGAVFHQGIAYVNDVGRLEARDYENGKNIWSTKIDQFLADFVISGDLIIARTRNIVGVIDRVTGKLLSHHPFRYRLMAFSNDRIIGVSESRVAAFSLEDQEISQLWTSEIVSGEYYQDVDMSVLDNHLAITSGGALQLFDLENGEIRWVDDAQYTGPPAVTPTNVYAISIDQIRQFDLQNGEQTRTFQVGEIDRLSERLLVTDDSVMFYGGSLGINVYSLDSGEQTGYFPGRNIWITEDMFYAYKDSELENYSRIRAYRLVDLKGLQLLVSNVLEEGGTRVQNLTIRVQDALSEDLSVSIKTNLRSRVQMPRELVLPAGATEISVPIAVVDDDRDNLLEHGYVMATAEGHSSSSKLVELKDNDQPIPSDIPNGINSSPIYGLYQPGVVGSFASDRYGWDVDLWTHWSPLVRNGFTVLRISAGGSSEKIAAFRTETGERLWDSDVSNRSKLLAIDSDSIYAFDAFDGGIEVVALDLFSGGRKWNFVFETEARILADRVQVVDVGDSVIVTIGEIGVWGLKKDDASVLWERAWEPDFRIHTFASGGRLFNFGKVYVWELDSASGETKRILDHGGLSLLAFDAETVIASGGVAIDLDTGERLWESEYPADAAVIAGDEVFLTMASRPEGETVVVSLDDGKRLHQYDYGGSSITVTNDSFLLGRGSRITLVDRHSGIARQIHEKSNFAYIAENTLFLGSVEAGDRSFRAIALSLDSRGSLDVNSDGVISPMDALLVVNSVNRGGASAENDVNGDGFVSPLDALIVINWLNSDGEGELTRSSLMASFFAPYPVQEIMGEQEDESFWIELHSQFSSISNLLSSVGGK